MNRFAAATEALRKQGGSIVRAGLNRLPRWVGGRWGEAGRGPHTAPRFKSTPVVVAEFDPQATIARESGHERSFGTFGGVFTPSFLTIIGVIMYLRFGWVVANAGLWQTIAIVVIANAITFITALSVSSIASNERMETGGAYFMVSRVLGHHAGGGIGIPLYFSQGISVAFYVIGFAESLTALFPHWDGQTVALITLAVLTVVGLVGARFMVRIQYLILAVILTSFLSIALGFRPAFTNFEPAYLPGLSFWAVFAVFFPAVTGLLAGVSMSGDLKDPARSIPRGILLAVGAGFLVYLAVPIMLAFTVPRDGLWASTALRDASRWPALVIAGIFGATLSSAIGSLLAAPRTLQALGIDGLVPRVFGSGVGKTQEPLVAMGFTIAISLVAILVGNLNSVAEVLTMFFLTTYGVLNLSAAIEHVVDNPSFRPALRVPWWVSMIGAATCVGVMLLINALATVIAVTVVALIFITSSVRRGRAAAHGGVWEGVWTGMLFFVARRLARSRSGSGKNWRPLIQVFASEVENHAELITTAAMLTQQGGALATYAMVERGVPNGADARATLSRSLHDFVGQLRRANAFVNVVETVNLQEGIVVASQAAAFAAGSYNTVMMGLPTNPREDREHARMLFNLSHIQKNVILFKKGARPWHTRRGPILVWWGGAENNVRLMIILAYLLQRSMIPAVPITVATIAGSEHQTHTAPARLSAALQELRVRAQTLVVENRGDRPIAEILAEHSREAAIVLVGMAPVDELTLRDYLPRLRDTATGLDTALLVLSNIPDIEYV